MADFLEHYDRLLPAARRAIDEIKKIASDSNAPVACKQQLLSLTINACAEASTRLSPENVAVDSLTRAIRQQRDRGTR